MGGAPCTSLDDQIPKSHNLLPVVLHPGGNVHIKPTSRAGFWIKRRTDVCTRWKLLVLLTTPYNTNFSTTWTDLIQSQLLLVSFTVQLKDPQAEWKVIPSSQAVGRCGLYVQDSQRREGRDCPLLVKICFDQVSEVTSNSGEDSKQPQLLESWKNNNTNTF